MSAAVAVAPVLVRFDRVYGRVVCYPANAQAEVLAKLVGTKTLTREAVAGARALGLEVQIAHSSVDHLAAWLAGEV